MAWWHRKNCSKQFKWMQRHYWCKFLSHCSRSVSAALINFQILANWRVWLADWWVWLANQWVAVINPQISATQWVQFQALTDQFQNAPKGYAVCDMQKWSNYIGANLVTAKTDVLSDFNCTPFPWHLLRLWLGGLEALGLGVLQQFRC